jgi:cobalt-zinc-cadmium efflux system membrane fusion protein
MIGIPIMRRADLRVLVVALMLVASAAACRRQSTQNADAEPSTLATPVIAAPVQVGSIRSVVHAAGSVTVPPDAEFLPTTRESSTILEMPRAEGEMVATGEVLVRLDIPSATQNVTRQRAELARAEAQLENANITLNRTRDVVERGLVPRRDLELAEQGLVAAKTDVARAQAALAAAEADAAGALIRAPFPGVVVRRFHNPGDALTGISTEPILRFVDTSRLEITVTMAAEDGGRIAAGATARVALVGDGPPIQLVVASTARAGTGTDVTARLTFVEAPALDVDTPVQVDIDADERTNALFVPAEAVIREGESQAVYIVRGDRAERRPVKTGLADATRIEIIDGVSRGELVITQGHIGLPDDAVISADVGSR